MIWAYHSMACHGQSVRWGPGKRGSRPGMPGEYVYALPGWLTHEQPPPRGRAPQPPRHTAYVYQRPRTSEPRRAALARFNPRYARMEASRARWLWAYGCRTIARSSEIWIASDRSAWMMLPVKNQTECRVMGSSVQALMYDGKRICVLEKVDPRSNSYSLNYLRGLFFPGWIFPGIFPGWIFPGCPRRAKI